MEKEQYTCVVCGHQHNEELEGIWNELPEDFSCPQCGCNKDEYYAQ